MHSWRLLRRTTPASHVLSAHRYNPLSLIFTQSLKPSNNGGSSSNGQHNQRKIESGVVVVGLSLGLGYWSSSLSDSKTRLGHADSHGQSQQPPKKPQFIFGDAYRRKIFFKYEKRIRTQSPPEKVFEYFASYRSPDGEVFMTPGDLMRAIVPVFPPSEGTRVREGYLNGELAIREGVLNAELVPCALNCPPSKFFMLFDTNNDGLISFAEYIFFVTLLSIPESSFSVAFKMFDLDNNGEIDREEFKKVMALMRTHHRQGSSHRDGLRHGLKVTAPVENGGLLESFFGKDGKSCLQHAKFVEFLGNLHNEILQLEFNHYDCKSRGTISAKDFALSMVASADMRHINKFLDRVDGLEDEPRLRDIRITFEEFKSFADLRKQLRPLSLAMFSYGKVNGLLSKQDFQRAAYQVCGIALSDNLVDMIFYVFDANRDGSLSSDEFLRVLQRREMDNIQPREAGLFGMISCWLECANNKCNAARILL